MNTRTSFILLGILSFFVLNNYAAAATIAGRILGADDIEKLLSNKSTYEFVDVSGRHCSYTFHENHALQGYCDSQYDWGTWSVKGSYYCQKWDKWDQGKESCFSVSDFGGGKVSFFRWNYSFSRNESVIFRLK